MGGEFDDFRAVGSPVQCAFFLKAYRPPREVTWFSGVALLGIALAFGFTGYLLPWNELAYFATKVGTEITGVLPIVGSFLGPLNPRRRRSHRGDADALLRHSRRRPALSHHRPAGPPPLSGAKARHERAAERGAASGAQAQHALLAALHAARSGGLAVGPGYSGRLWRPTSRRN